ncbi:MAG: NUDIX domain-containing protein [Planctomycetaceae bacterium]|nr:NUDIX domain-containing protein [Planctomycetaceae bacterium]
MAVVKSCGVLVVRGNPIKEFLLMKHADRWDLPKGHMDPGESEVECALRELEEETGIQYGDLEMDSTFRYWSRYTLPTTDRRHPGQRKDLIIFLARLLHDVEIQVTEHLDYEWFTWHPPHDIQEQTINPLLAALQEHIDKAEDPSDDS